MSRSIAYIGLGSNLPSFAGSSKATLAAATERLNSFAKIAAQSAFYQTEPVGNSDQPEFVNAAVAIETVLRPLDLLDHLLHIERAFGRERSHAVAKGPRTLDLDLLLIDNLVLHSSRLVLPHPAMAERRFVLAPLTEIAPNLVHPILGKTIATLLAELRDEGANRIAAVKIS
jgi:2-amino-4-hydroxy-6-hydroxymethyldihydropteridine diphosphokinase